MNQKCIGLMGFLFGHKYQARYTTHQVHGWRPDPMAFVQVENFSVPESDVNDRTYHGDICLRCGNVAGNSTTSNHSEIPPAPGPRLHID